MLIYLIVFALSILLIYCSEKFSSKSWIRKISVFGALAMPTLLAGLRANSIGTDTISYLVPIFDNAQTAKNFAQFQGSQFVYHFSNTTVSEYEIGFTTLVYIVTKLFGNLCVLQTIIAGSIIGLVYAALNKWKRDVPVWFGMAVFYFMYFNGTMNLMRQWMAMSILLLGLQYIFGRKKKFFLYVLAACLFHKSALLGIVFYVLYYFIKDHKKQSKKKNKKRYVLKLNRRQVSLTDLMVGLVFVTATVAILFVNKLVTPVLNLLGLSRYQYYLSGIFKFMPNQVILRIPILILLILGRKEFKKKYLGANFFIAMILLDLVVSQLAGITSNSWRISVYFSMFSIISIPALYKCTRRISQKLTGSIMMVYLLVYWIYFFVLMGTHATVPYVPFWMA